MANLQYPLHVGQILGRSLWRGQLTKFLVVASLINQIGAYFHSSLSSSLENEDDSNLVTK